MDSIKSLRNDLIFALNVVGNYKTHKKMWDAFYAYDNSVSIPVTRTGHIRVVCKNGMNNDTN